MPELRWILITFGLALLIGIYVWGRRASRQADASEQAPARPGPRFEREDDYAFESEREDPQLAAEFEEYSSAGGAATEPAFAGDQIAGAETDEPEFEPPLQRASREARRARIEPTFTESLAESSFAEPTADETRASSAASEADVGHNDSFAHEDSYAPRPAPATDAPTLGMSSTPPPRRIERRKIIALRIAAGPEPIDGGQLKAAFEAEALQHGKYDVFHRLEADGAALFSIASMVEPGTFDPDAMESETYPGLTLFAQLPGPLAGMIAFNELVACARRLHSALGGTLQDERGVPLTVHRIEKIRQEIREFEQRSLGESAQRV